MKFLVLFVPIVLARQSVKTTVTFTIPVKVSFGPDLVFKSSRKGFIQKCFICLDIHIYRLRSLVGRNGTGAQAQTSVVNPQAGCKSSVTGQKSGPGRKNFTPKPAWPEKLTQGFTTLAKTVLNHLRASLGTFNLQHLKV